MGNGESAKPFVSTDFFEGVGRGDFCVPLILSVGMLVAPELRRKKNQCHFYNEDFIFSTFIFYYSNTHEVQFFFLLSFFIIAAEKAQNFSRFRRGGCGG